MRKIRKFLLKEVILGLDLSVFNYDVVGQISMFDEEMSSVAESSQEYLEVAESDLGGGETL